MPSPLHEAEMRLVLNYIKSFYPPFGLDRYAYNEFSKDGLTRKTVRRAINLLAERGLVALSDSEVMYGVIVTPVEGGTNSES